MRLTYDLGILIYYLLILLVSPFNLKARQWIRGRRGLLSSMAAGIGPEEPLIWFHCSSLGEFEQGRPVIEKIREECPGKKILLTFYSPSGYEVRKDYHGADHVFYLPLDTRRNAKRMLAQLNIEQAFFVKYEFWYHYLSRLNSREIPVCLVSGIFRKEQVFFRWYGGWYRKILGFFDHLFVQQESSLELLGSIGISNASVSGDTRFDRVSDIARKVSIDNRFLSFRGDSRLVVAGSTWPADEDLLVRYINESGRDCKWLIAPHEIHEAGINRLSRQIRGITLRYTELKDSLPDDANVLIIDTIGLLSSLYQYAHISYIGGGFGKGIHNTLEAATFEIPVIFGPNYHKFQEAGDLVDRRAAFPVSGYGEFKSVMNRLLDDDKLLKTSGDSAGKYVKSMTGASAMIVDFALKRKTQ
jgi:3-deoxy-D-manno-octulosonic-acid transferase